MSIKGERNAAREAIEQIKLFNWITFAKAATPELDMLYHIPNGGTRNKIEAANFKRQGVRAGVPDLCLPVACGNYHGLYIELKYGKNTPTKKQKDWLQRLRAQGYAAEVCYGWEQAKHVLEKYLKMRKDDENEKGQLQRLYRVGI